MYFIFLTRPVCNNSKLSQNIKEKTKLIWKMEKLPLKFNTTDKEKSWSKNFTQKVTRNEKGRFVVKLLFKVNVIFSSAIHIHLQVHKDFYDTIIGNIQKYHL